jgi:DNA-binding NtrC family response regulator
MSGLTVLIVSTDAVIGALLALYVEAYGHRAVLADEGERPADAIARSGATVILVDADRPDCCSSAFVAEQRAAGRRVIAYSPSMLAHELRQRVERLRVPWLSMPLEGERFGALLKDAAAAARPRE